MTITPKLPDAYMLVLATEPELMIQFLIAAQQKLEVPLHIQAKKQLTPREWVEQLKEFFSNA